jgi:hypothetical protein
MTEHLRSCVDAASSAERPEAAVLDWFVGSFNSRPAVVRLVQRWLFQLNILAVFVRVSTLYSMSTGSSVFC